MKTPEAWPSYPPTPSLPGQALFPRCCVEDFDELRTKVDGFFSSLPQKKAMLAYVTVELY
jgi:hypothetical protein